MNKAHIPQPPARLPRWHTLVSALPAKEVPALQQLRLPPEAAEVAGVHGLPKLSQDAAWLRLRENAGTGPFQKLA